VTEPLDRRTPDAPVRSLISALVRFVERIVETNCCPPFLRVVGPGKKIVFMQRAKLRSAREVAERPA